MPVGKCACGRETNSTTSNWWYTKSFGNPAECYAALEEVVDLKHGKVFTGNYVNGCAFDKLPKGDFQREFAESLFNRRKK